jgi:hypothetical protein
LTAAALKIQLFTTTPQRSTKAHEGDERAKRRILFVKLGVLGAFVVKI